MSAIKPKPIPLRVLPVYPTMGSLTDVLAYAESHLPLSDVNQLHQILYIYHNTLITLLGSQSND